ncbi:PstS family phosphate ABC transporter substrate-binding protein [Acanthopleuribacter pedis]|uniref:PstS family phosphate ABC transporter substrate-binding protein n=2 Tax=Acanthopleuribacter pedis TaxID=442870 RepID=A0A8J7U3U2_9BACT|nr:PstS family phosphate ABC transporter substrate-binding protein [Acanthopleuribacter pedis]MBO1319124.1 PstS family phosphate ABC transporter substrate-binding protein [Acanthopleuribacter pedis]
MVIVPLIAQEFTLLDALDDFPRYQRRSGISGSVNSVGSDTLNNLMALWGEGFRRRYPSVNFQVEGKGSSTAPPALMEGVAQIGPMSRLMSKDELDAFRQKMGFLPTAIPVALDALAIYVHNQNPLVSISLPELDAAFSVTHRGGLDRRLETWSDLGVTGVLGRYPLSLYGRNSASGTYGFFKMAALFGGDFQPRVKELPGSAAVVLSVSLEPASMGYAGIGYRAEGVRALHVSKDQGLPAVAPVAHRVVDGEYPLGRALYIYVVKPPSEMLPAVVEEFVQFILSYEGQRIVVKSGYIPLPRDVANTYRRAF